MKKSLKIIELFSGVRSQTKALQRLNIKHEVIGVSEIDKYAVKSAEAIYGPVHNFGDITKIEKLPYCDLLTYSFPCFIEGTKVLTYGGFKNIEEINCGDMVLTHKNRYKKVIKPMINQADKIYKLSTMCSDDLFVTEEHPFLVREKYKEWDNESRVYKRKFKIPKWIKVKDLNKDFYVGIAINQEGKLPTWEGSTFKWSGERKDRHSNVLSEKFRINEFWWLIGRYLGDGWIRSQGEIIICCEKSETTEITEKLEILDFNYCLVEEETVNKIHISFKEIGEYVEQFGRGAKNKHLTGDIFNLPKNLLESFIEGYMSADGCFTQGVNKATSISNELIYGIGQCVAKVYQRPFSIYKTTRPKNCVIENRIVNQNDTYQITWKNESNVQDKSFYEEGYIWCPINKVEKLNYEGAVYNFEVEEDNSYVVQNIIVHNCQDISVAGKQAGIKEGTRSGLLFEVERLLEGMEERPKYLLLENVKNLVGKQHKADFDRWLDRLEEFGYRNYWKVLNAKDYGIPQNRERVFVVSIRKDLEIGFDFPIAFTNGNIITYTLQKQVRKRKNTCDIEELKKLLKNSKTESGMTINQISEILEEKKTLVEHWFRNDDCFSVPESENWFKLKEVLKIGTEKFDNFITEFEIVDGVYEKANRVYGLDGISPTLTTVGVPDVILYEFPEKQELKLKLKDILKDVVDEKFYINQEKTEKLIETLKDKDILNDDKEIKQVGMLDIKGNEQIRRVYADEGISPTLNTMQGGNRQPKILQENYRIRKLTPIECWRLMGFDDEDFEKAKAAGVSNSQLYKQAGNSIVVNVLEAIFKNLFKPEGG